MPKRLVKKGVTVIRDGRRVRPEVGKAFDFTKEEIEGLKEADATALGTVEETKNAEDGTATAAATSTPTPSAEQSQAKAKDGKKKATATKSDAENAKDDDGGEAPEGEGGGPGAGTVEPGVDDADDDL